MRRYLGEPIGSQPKVAVISNDALGNYVVVTPLFQKLKEKYPGITLHYYGGGRTQEFWTQEPLLDAAFSLFGNDPATITRLAQQHAPYDLVINVESSEWASCFTALLCGEETFVVGPCLASTGRGKLPLAEDEAGRLAADPEWIREGIQNEYGCLKTGFIGEIFCRLAYLDGPIPTYRLPSRLSQRELPDVLIAMSASLPEKLWPLEKWEATMRAIQGKGLSVGLLGANPSAQSAFWKGVQEENYLVEHGLVRDLRGEFTLSEVVGALGSVKRVLTLDNGILHMAASTQTPTVGLFRHGIHRLWAPPAPNVTVLTPGCGNAVAEIEVEKVREALFVGL